jgi:hypothetical protein
MDKNIKANVSDQAVKGALLGAIGYAANKYGVSAEIVAVIMPIALTALAWVSTKIGDKGTTALFSVVTAVVEAQSKSKKKA